MGNQITKGKGIFGSVNVATTGGFRIKDVAFTGTMSDLNQLAQSGITLGGGSKLSWSKWVSAVVTPAHSSLATGSTELRSYSTGLTSLSLVIDDQVIVFPNTGPISGVSIGNVGCRTAGCLSIEWINPHPSSAVSGFPTHFKILSIRPVTG